ncbi:hemolysin family protein [Iningainema tapete]|uniref:HlyC/CorC family transporter n=1 Tax=Iningainema tapete BLCC-T55 TaxID=2748662 RepID=A0A8J6XQF9_9CYAN|nr:hemolysin family protein [Iningainema tapete]MBD2774607.1 HlyC/CorC family transporter [Iningainema tapete BLCC-T55]
MSPTIEILIILLLILTNGVFVMSELAIVSARKVRLQQLANQGDAKARVALELASSPNQFFAIVQVVITLLGILIGAYGEEPTKNRLEPILNLIPWLAPYKESIAQALAIVIITYFSLIIGELVPKRVALNNPELIASFLAIPMQMLVSIGSPIVYVLSISTDTVLRVLGIRPSTEPQVTEEEIRVLIEQGTEEGTFEEAEQDMVERVFRLGDRPVSSIMTPRPDIIWLDLEDTAEENRRKIIDNGYSRYPVCQGGLDNVLGIIPVTDLLARSFCGEALDLTVGLRQPVFVPESTRGLKVLELFKQTITHMALVVDEYGVIQGLVTLNDVMIEIVGEVPSDDEQEDPQVVQREDGSWLLDGMLSVDEFFELFNVQPLAEEHRGSYQTLGGFVMAHLGRIPTAADFFEWQGMRLEVMDMDGNRVDKVLVMPQSQFEDSKNSE